MIRAGRGDGGQPKQPDPAKPDPARSGDPSPVGGSTRGPAPAPTPTAARARARSAGTGTSAATLPDRDDEETGDRQPDGSAGAATDGGAANGRKGRAGQGALRRALSHAWLRHLILIVVYLGAGVAATWPRFTYLADGKLPATADVSGFVWNLWWSGHQLLHLGNPFFTRYMAAPVGTHLAFSTLMPLAGWITAPITVLYGPSASFTVLTILTPGLLCYAMYRAAKLWLNEPGAIVAGAFFGLSSMLAWQNWYHVNIAIGTIFLPVTIEAAVRFRRSPRLAPAIALGAALGGSILINQESTVVAIVLAAVILLPWIIGTIVRNRALAGRAMGPLAIGAAIALVIASPELIAMVQQAISGGAEPPIGQLALNYTQFGVSLPTLFAPSPRLGTFGLGNLASSYSYNGKLQVFEGLPTFGAVLTGVALMGLVIGWRKRTTWAFLALWLSGAILALGTSLTIGSCRISQGIYHRPGKVYGQSCQQYLPLMTHLHFTNVIMPGGPDTGVWKPVVISNLMPYSWLVRIPGLSGLREADRFALVGLIGAAMLAGLTVQWLSKRKLTMPLIAVVVALGVLEAGWSGNMPTSQGFHGTMPTTLPALDRPLTRDHSRSIVVDVPYGLRGGVAYTGSEIAPNALLIATHDGHPRAISYTAWVSKAAINGIGKHAFFRNLYIAEHSKNPGPAMIARARADLKTMNIGWVIEWRNLWTKYHPIARLSHIDRYLEKLGFRHTHGMCLVRIPPGERCPHGKNIWLWQYKPGRTG